MQCPICGKQLPNGASFCTACGVSVSETQQQTSVPKKTRRALPYLIGILIGLVLAAGVIIFNGALRADDADADRQPKAEATASPEPSEAPAPNDAASPQPNESSDPGDANLTNVVVDGGINAGEVEAPWEQLTDAGYKISIRRLNAYSGPFLEDGSDEEVSNVLALQFRNDGDQDLQYAEYVFNINGVDVPFKLSNLAVGQRCVVLAANRQAYNAADVLKLKSRLVAHVDSLRMDDSKLLLVDNGDNSVTVLNLTDQPVPVARVFYKTYYAEQNTFVGGITYTIELKNIPANGSATAAPEHYNTGISRFVGSGVYDS